jgi:hypothetical protein
MKELEKTISTLVESQFPSFYRDEGQNFVAFVKAYYEWMEASNNAVYHSRRLLEYGDIDSTVDDFIIHFKEKYLNNIQFTTSSNKKLLIKKAQDLYRSKGTERSIDLFFKLVYGIDTRVYVPGTDIFKLSDGKWVKPTYLEVTREARNINYVGKQVTGASSGATAFVEKLVRKRVQGQYIDIFYISAVNGTFVTNELILVDEVYDGAPIMVGSFTSLELVGRASGYEVGDIVDIISTTSGGYGKGRVTSVSNATGVVDFELIDGGFGYRTGSDVLVSERVLTLGNVNVTDSNLLFPFTQFETVSQPIANVTIQPIITLNLSSNDAAFSDGEVIYQEIDSTNTVLATVVSQNSTAVVVKYANTGEFSTALTIKGDSSGANGVISGFSFNTNDVNGGETVTSYYSNGVISGQGVLVQRFANSTPYIAVYKVAVTNGNIYDSANANYSETIYVSNTSTLNAVVATTNAYANVWATANVIGVSNTVTLYLSDYAPAFLSGEPVSQGSSANGVVSSVQPDGSNVYLTVSSTRGVFTIGNTVTGASSAASGNVQNFGLTIGLHDITNSFTNTALHAVTGETSNTTANVISISTGTGAEFDILSLDNEEQIVVGTDLISGLNNADVQYNTLNLNATFFGFPKLPSGNLTNSTLLQQLTYLSANIGTISAIGNFNPGSNYNVDPFVIVYDPYIAPFNRKDLNIQYTKKTVSSFIVGEIINQTIALPNTVVLTISSASNTFIVGELVNQSNGSANTANGYISVVDVAAGSGTLTLRNVQGTFVNTAGIYLDAAGYTSTANASIDNVNAVSLSAVAKGIIKSANNTNLIVKPITFNTQFKELGSIIGTSTSANGDIVFITIVSDSYPSGLNADVLADVITANGVVTGLQRIDSGYGYTQNQLVNYQKPGKSVGTARIKLGEQGISEGYYSSTDGFLSQDKYLFDGDYYQEYSYEIISKLPFEKYSDIFKAVMHTAGTRVFGAVALDSEGAFALQSPAIDDKIFKLQISDMANTEFFANNETVYQSNGTANVAIGKILSTQQTELVLSNANIQYQIGTTIYQPNVSVNAASGYIAAKVSDSTANTLTMYLTGVRGTFSDSANIEGTTNTVLTIAPYIEMYLRNITNPDLGTGSFQIGEGVTSNGSFVGVVQNANEYEAEIVITSGTVSPDDVITGDSSGVTAEVVSCTNAVATIGGSVYQYHVILNIVEANGSFSNGESIYIQRLNTSSTDQTFQNTAVAIVTAANSTALVLEDTFGPFIKRSLVYGATSGARARIDNHYSVNTSIATVVGANSTSVTVINSSNVFLQGFHVYGANVAGNVTSISYETSLTPSSNVSSAINTILVSNATADFTTAYTVVGANNGANATVTYVENYND